MQAKTNTGDIIIGLTLDNIKLLLEDKPILIDGELLKIEHKIIIFYSKDKNEIMKLMKNFIKENTVIHDNDMSRN